MQNFLITGGAGFVGSQLAEKLLQNGHRIIVLDNLARVGSSDNMQRLCGHANAKSNFEFVEADVRDAARIDELVLRLQPDAVFHLAGQVAMTTSVADPRADFEINVAGTIHVLEAVRRLSSESVVIYASSNKVYGNLSHLNLEETPTRYRPCSIEAIDENAPLEFHTPYGCSKGAADQYVLDYARSFGLRTVVFRHSTIYGGRQHATFDQGWVGWFCRQAVETKRNPNRAPFTIAGDGKQVRDLLHVEDAIEAYVSAYRAASSAVESASPVCGEAFNLGGGVQNSLSLVELFTWLEAQLAITLRYEQLPWRLSDQKYFVADNGKASAALVWSPRVTKEAGLEQVLLAELAK